MLVMNNVVSYSSKAFQYAFNKSASLRQEISGTVNHFRRPIQYGWQQGKRLSGQQGLNPVESLFAKTTGSARQFAKTKLRKEDLPAVGGLVGSVVPVPFMTFVGYYCGKVLKNIMK